MVELQSMKYITWAFLHICLQYNIILAHCYGLKVFFKILTLVYSMLTLVGRERLLLILFTS